MKIIALLALTLIALLALAAEPNRVRTGKVITVSSNGMALDQGSAGTISIGFVVDAGAAESLKKIKKGDEVRAVFGSAKGPSGNSINKLLSVRVCAKNDKECTTDYKNQDAQARDDEKKWKISQEKQEICRSSMQKSLVSDSRYTPENSVPASDSYLEQYNALKGTARTCASNLLKGHETAVLEACLLHHCGDNIGGGCWHIAGYAMNSSAIQNAVNQCSKQ